MSGINFALSELFNKHNTDIIHQDITKFIKIQYSELSESVKYEDLKSFLIAVQKVRHAEINYDTVLTIENILQNISFCASNVNSYKENDWYIHNFVNAYANLSQETQKFLKNEYTLLSFKKLKNNLESRIRLEMLDVQKYYNVLINLYNNLCDKNPPDKKEIETIFLHNFNLLHPESTTKLIEENDYIEYSFFEDLNKKIDEYTHKRSKSSNLKDDAHNIFAEISEFIKNNISNIYKKPFVFGYSFNDTLMLYNNINMFIEVMTKYEIKQLDDNLENTLRSKGYSKHNNYEIALIINNIDSSKQVLILAKIIILLSIIYTNDQFQLNKYTFEQLKIKNIDVFMNVLSLFAISRIAIDHEVFKRQDTTHINTSSQEIGDNFVEIKFILEKLNNMNNIKHLNNFLHGRKIHTLTKTHLTYAQKFFAANLETAALNLLYLDKNFHNSDFLNMVNKLKYLESKNINILLTEANHIFCINNNKIQTYAEILEIIINMNTTQRVKYFLDRINLFQQDDMSNATAIDQYFFIILKVFFNVTKALHDFWNIFDLDIEILKIMNHSCSKKVYCDLCGYSDIPVYCDLSGDIDSKYEELFTIYRDALEKQKKIILDNLLTPANGNFLDYDYLYRHFLRHLYFEKYLNFYNIISEMDKDPNYLFNLNLYPDHAALLQEIHTKRIDSIIKNLAKNPQYLDILGIDKDHIDLLLKLYVNNQNINQAQKPIKNTFILYHNRVNNNNVPSANSNKSIKKKNSESSLDNNIENKTSEASIGYKQNCEDLRQSHAPGFYAEEKRSTPKCIV